MTAPAAPPGRFDDLRTRVISAAVMVPVGAAAVWLGGSVFAILVILLTAAMIWELATITAPDRRDTPLVLAAVAAMALGGAIFVHWPGTTGLLALPAVLLFLTPRANRGAGALLALGIMLAGYGLVVLRDGQGAATILWLVLVVVASDLAGYFVGRVVGGRKFWPAISPKKTWSGTAAGWAAAVLVGLGFVLAGMAGPGLLVLSAGIALAGQLGDIAESLIKRRCGVKDASGLIPGHGGVMDRFDALTGAVVAVILLGLVVPLPLPVPLAAGGG